MDSSESNWLLPDHTDRERMLDMDRRLAPTRRLALGVLAAGLLIMGPWIGWWTLVPLLVAGVLFGAADRIMEGGVKQPEYWLFGAWIGSQVVIAISVFIVWAPDVPVMSWFAIPIVTLSTRFSQRGVVIGVLFTFFLMGLIAVVSQPGEVVDSPPLIVMPMLVVLAVGILSTTLMRSDIQHRDEAIIDPLTSMLNRKAMDNRIGELRAQAGVSGASVGVVVVDIDHFKLVNDTVGHAIGDAVLRDVAYTIRKDLRAFELAYRLGGEEFLVLVPGADLSVTRRLAEGIRERIENATYPEGLSVTVSCGIAASGKGESFDFTALYAAADASLYEAKRLGRNRVQGPKLDAVPTAA
jgi:diguanylate cyclase (GGDEF)-like protein